MLLDLLLGQAENPARGDDMVAALVRAWSFSQREC